MDKQGKKTSSVKGKSKMQAENSESQSAKWDDETNLIFVELCEEEIRKGNRPGTSFTSHGWDNLVVEFNKRTGKSYTKKQMKNHWDKMKKHWRMFKDLMRGETGLGFDASRNTINVDEQWWEDKIAENEDYKKFKDKDLSLFWYRYDAIFSDIVATGERARASSEIGTSLSWNDVNDEEEDNTNMEGYCEGEDLRGDGENVGGLSDDVRDHETLFPPMSTLNETSRKRITGKKRKTSGAAALKEDISSLLKLMQNKSSSSESHGDPTITQCMDILKDIPGMTIGTGLWFYSCNIFSKKEMREIFIGQPSDATKLSCYMDSWDITNIISPNFTESSSENEDHSREADKENKELEVLSKLTSLLILEYYEKYIHKIPCRTSAQTGHKLIMEILHGNEARCYQAFRMIPSVFLNLCQDLQLKYHLTPTRGMSIHEEVAIFLMICGHGVGNRIVQEMFNHSGETIHRHFHRVLTAVTRLAKDIIKPHEKYNGGDGYHVPQHQKYLPFFKDCIGAIDGTHVKARVPKGQEIPYIGRKGYPTQNVLAVVDFNMCFTFAWAGWEGAAHDSRIFGEATRNANLNFPHPSEQKYYLVDAGYGHKKGYMAPYKGANIRYHLEDFRRARTGHLRQPRGYKEAFNFLHSSCRNIIERTFGVWKARFSILGDMPNYSLDSQTNIVLATMAIHNYIRKNGGRDPGFQTAENETYVPPDGGISSTTNCVMENEDSRWETIRDAIAFEITINSNL